MHIQPLSKVIHVCRLNPKSPRKYLSPREYIVIQDHDIVVVTESQLEIPVEKKWLIFVAGYTTYNNDILIVSNIILMMMLMIDVLRPLLCTR